MRKLRISRLYAKGFKGQTFDIRFNGQDAVIRGANGSGKTTVADAYFWVLTNKQSDGRQGEVGRFDETGKVDTKSAVEVEVTFDNGMRFKREANGAGKYWINGAVKKSSEYYGAINALTNGAIGILSKPEGFCQLHWKERRTILLELLGDSRSEAELPEEAIVKANAAIRKLKQESAGLPGRIDELSRQVAGIRGDRAELEKQLSDLQSKQAAMDEQARVQRESSKTAQDELGKLREAVLKLEAGIEQCRLKLQSGESELKRLRNEYCSVKSALTGECPVCGSKVKAGKQSELQSKLNEIVSMGRKLAETQETLKRGKSAAETKLKDIDSELAMKRAEIEVQEAVGKGAQQERDNLQEQLNKIKVQLREIDSRSKAQSRIEELKRREREVGEEISGHEGRIYEASRAIQRRIEQTEETLNAQFEIVRFKMFESYKVSEGVKEQCEPLVGGVPYSLSLSKGERLKASLDILKTLQRHYGVELPVWIDDAESYTSNSVVEVPNQTIQLKATEGVVGLKVELQAAVEQLSLFKEELVAS